MKILVIQMKFIGDVLATSIICNNLKKIYPNSQIDFLVYPFTKPVIENNPNIDTIVFFEEKYRKSKIELIKFLLKIRKENYDIIIDAYGKLESNLVTLFSKSKKKISYYKSYTNFFYTDTIKTIKVPKTNAGTSLENRMSLISFFKTNETLEIKPKIFLTKDEIENGRNIIANYTKNEKQLIFMISVIGSGKEKTYPFSYMSKILDFLVDKTNAKLIYNYMESQQKEANEIFSLCKENTKNNTFIQLVPGNLRDFLSITNHCDALIGNEGGAVNMAKALDIPTFTIFSPWINKNDWNCFEDGKKHVSVHLEDYKPEFYSSKEKKYFKKTSEEMYSELKPDFIFPKLESFLNQFSTELNDNEQD